MRGILTVALAGILAVLLQSAANASILKDLGMGLSMKERLISAPSTITTITTVPAGLVKAGPVSYKVGDGSLTYRVLLGPDGHTTVKASGKAGNKAWTDSLLVGSYPLDWKPSTRRVAAAASGGNNSGTMVASSNGGSQPSGNNNNLHPSYGNVGGWCCSFELQLGQDLTSWNPLTNQLGGSTSAGSADLKGGVKVNDSLSILGGAHLGYSKDNSWSWRDNAASNSVLAGPLVGLRWQANPNNRFELGVSYDFVVQGDPALATSPVDVYASWNGDHGRWYHRAKVVSSLPTSSNGMRLELGARPLEQLPQLNVHAVAQGRQIGSVSGKTFDPAKDLRAQWGGGLGFDVTDQVNVGIEILAPSKPGDTVSLGVTTGIHF